tara:strand:- start:340 stop:723 length:384 start_codon:yes stop_codon:yes gene_type:complete
MPEFGVEYRDSIDPSIDPISIAGTLRNRRLLPQMEDVSSVGTISLFDALIENLWMRVLSEYERRSVGWNLIGENTIPYPDKEVWWDDPRSRLDLSMEYHKLPFGVGSEEEELLNEALKYMEEGVFEY